MIYNFLNKKEGQNVIAKKDELLENMNDFERSLKMRTDKLIGENEYEEFLKDNVLPWKKKEKEKIKTSLDELNRLLKDLSLSIDEEIHLVKTTGREEFNSAYTRMDTIFLPQRRIESYNNLGLTKFLAHELFHIISRNNFNLRKKLYEVIGFKLVNNIKLPQKYLKRRMTNPDAPLINSYITVLHKERKVKVTPVILLKDDYENISDDKDILKKLDLKLLVLEDIEGKLRVKYKKDEPVCLDFVKVDGFLDKVGANTDSSIQPEEILAENFALLVTGYQDVPSPGIIEKMKDILVEELN
ncbi:MAG: hypothetical protein FH753_11320 [Firmicutes bacterium]|nr:hypothetical protein [Bacillota bacterium]